MTLSAVQSDTLQPVQHGFFTRLGGHSTGVYAGLNCGQGSEDASEAVQANRAAVAEFLSLEPGALLSVHQHHSADAVTVTAPFCAARPKADAMVTATPGLGLGVLTADCAPVLFADPEAQVIGAAHAGWKGALGGVLEATVAGMETLGAKRQQIRAAVGPTISQRNYEVGPDFLDQFLAENADFDRFFAAGRGDRMQFDLPGFLLHQLRGCGLGDVRWTGHCTYADAERFFSYRRATHKGEADYGRLIAVIRL